MNLTTFVLVSSAIVLFACNGAESPKVVEDDKPNAALPPPVAPANADKTSVGDHSKQPDQCKFLTIKQVLALSPMPITHKEYYERSSTAQGEVCVWSNHMPTSPKSRMLTVVHYKNKKANGKLFANYADYDLGKVDGLAAKHLLFDAAKYTKANFGKLGKTPPYWFTKLGALGGADIALIVADEHGEWAVGTTDKSKSAGALGAMLSTIYASLHK